MTEPEFTLSTLTARRAFLITACFIQRFIYATVFLILIQAFAIQAICISEAKKNKKITKIYATIDKCDDILIDVNIFFRGIPYGTPPVGERRWKDAEPILTWNRELDATRYIWNMEQGIFGTWNKVYLEHETRSHGHSVKRSRVKRQTVKYATKGKTT